jgi:hypothetical protein
MLRSKGRVSAHGVGVCDGADFVRLPVNVLGGYGGGCLLVAHSWRKTSNG